MVSIGNSWDSFFETETKKDYYLSLREFLKSEYKKYRVYPPMDNIFAAFCETPIENVRVVILGQDPYHQPGQAHGLSFSVMEGVAPPPSLCNIKKEIEDDLGISMGQSGCLLPWARQGVFLLNASLTVRDSSPNSHAGKGWELLTGGAVKLLNDDMAPKVFLLWGRGAERAGENITNPRHLVLKSAHPSPLSASRGFFGCRHFSKANAYLKENGRGEVDWRL